MTTGPEAAYPGDGAPFPQQPRIHRGGPVPQAPGGVEGGQDLTGEVFQGDSDHAVDADAAVPVRYSGPERTDPRDPDDVIQGLSPLAVEDTPGGDRIVYVRAMGKGREGSTARTALRVGAFLGAAVVAGGVVLLGVRACAPVTETQITVQQANSIIDNISLVDREQFAEAHGSDTVDISSAMRTEIAGIPFTGIKAWTPWYGGEHAGGTETGYVDAILERSNAVSLAAAKDKKGDWYVKATVDVTGLGIQGVDDFWKADGAQQDGPIMKFLSIFVNTNREDRLNDTEDMALNNLEGSGTAVLGNPDVVAAGIAYLIEDNILNPSAKLLDKIGPEGAQLLNEMAGQPVYLQFVSYETKGTDRGKAIVDTSSNVLPPVTPVESSQHLISVPVVVGPPSEISLGTEAQMSKGTLVDIAALNEYAKILSKVAFGPNGWYVVQPQTPAQLAGSSKG